MNTLHFNKLNTKHTLHLFFFYLLFGFVRCLSHQGWWNMCFVLLLFSLANHTGHSSLESYTHIHYSVVFLAFITLDAHKPHSVNILIQLYHFSTISNPPETFLIYLIISQDVAAFHLSFTTFHMSFFEMAHMYHLTWLCLRQPLLICFECALIL